MANSFKDHITVGPGQALAYPGGTRTPPGNSTFILDVVISEVGDLEESAGAFTDTNALALLTQALEPALGRKGAVTAVNELKRSLEGFEQALTQALLKGLIARSKALAAHKPASR